MNYKKLINKLSKISDTFSLAVDYGVFLFQKLTHPKYSVIYTIKYLIVLKFYGTAS